MPGKTVYQALTQGACTHLTLSTYQGFSHIFAQMLLQLAHPALQVGDILYMPRGTIHQAVAQESASTHLTISTYQGFSYGVLAQAVLQTALEGQEKPVCLPHTLRQGLPWGFLYQYGMQVSKTRFCFIHQQHVVSILKRTCATNCQVGLQ